MAAAYEKQRKGFESLQRLTASLAESLNRPLPQLQEATARLTFEGGVTLVSRQARLLLHISFPHTGVWACLKRKCDVAERSFWLRAPQSQL